MKRRYKVIEALGGQVYETQGRWQDRPAIDLTIPGLGRRWFTEDQVTLVIPGEFPDGATAIVEKEDGQFHAFTRRNDVAAKSYPTRPEYCWWWHDNGEWIRWKDVCEQGEPRLAGPTSPSVDPNALCPTCNSYVRGARDCADLWHQEAPNA